jgi:hypothetical protein
LSAQANFVPGGCLLVLSIAAPASDGTAMLNVTKLWADHCRNLLNKHTNGYQSYMPLSATSVDRAAIDIALAQRKEPFDEYQAAVRPHLVGCGKREPTSKDACELHDRVEVDPGYDSNHDVYQAPDMKPYLFYMPQSMYTALRKELASVQNTTEVSGNDIICAFIWKSVIRAWAAVRLGRRDIDVDEQATLAMPFDAKYSTSSACQLSWKPELRARVHASATRSDRSRHADPMGS